MPNRRGSLYEIIDTATDTVLSRHRTRQAAIDNWRTRWSGRAIKIVRAAGTPDRDVLVVEGTWHEPTRP